jgi:peptide/nickel transport system substrate-binding protein
MKLRAAFSLSAALLALACRPEPAPAPQPERPLRILLGVEPVTLDPHVPFDTASSVFLDNLFESLVRFDRSLRLRAGLALRWINPDDRTWRFFLDPEARFPDGTPLKASDVKFSIERVRSLAGSQIMGFARHVVGATVVDAHTIDIRTDTPIAILNSLAFIPIVSESHLSAAGSKIGEQPFGTGPYHLTRWDPGRSIVLEANPHYKPAPPIRRVEFLFAVGDAKLLETLATAKPELAALLRWSLRDELEKRKSSELRLVSAPGLGVYYLQLNLRPQLKGMRGRNPFQDKRVRRALALATDADALIRDGIHGTGRPATQLVASQVFGFDPSIPAIAHDPATARALLAEAGHASLEVPLLVEANRDHAVENLLIGQWAKAGIRGVLQEVPSDKLQATQEAGDFVASIQGFACTSADASEMLTSALHTPAPERGDGAFNYGAFGNAEIDSIADENLKVFDPRRRLEMLQRSLRIAAEELPAVPLFVSDDLYLIAKQLNWEPTANGVLDVSQMSFAGPDAPAPR